MSSLCVDAGWNWSTRAVIHGPNVRSAHRTVTHWPILISGKRRLLEGCSWMEGKRFLICVYHTCRMLSSFRCTDREKKRDIWKGSSRHFNYCEASQIIYIGLLSCLPLSSGVFILIPVMSWSIRVGSVCTLVSFVPIWAFLSGNVVMCWSSIISALSPIWVKSWKLAQRLKNKKRH